MGINIGCWGEASANCHQLAVRFALRVNFISQDAGPRSGFINQLSSEPTDKSPSSTELLSVNFRYIVSKINGKTVYRVVLRWKLSNQSWYATNLAFHLWRVFRDSHPPQVEYRVMNCPNRSQTRSSLPIKWSRASFDRVQDILRVHQVDEQGGCPTCIGRKVRIVNCIVRSNHINHMMAGSRWGV